jgi:hypothetical protein
MSALAITIRMVAEFKRGAYGRAMASAREVLKREPKNRFATDMLSECAPAIKILQTDQK